MILLVALVLLYIAIRVIWYLIPGIKCGPPEVVTNPEPIENNPGPQQKIEDKLQLLNMDIKHYTEQYEQLEHIKPKNIKQEIALQEKQYRIERKIASAVLEMERLQTPD